MGRRLAWRACYELLAIGVRGPQWSFMNYGLAQEDDAPPSTADPERLSANLYDHVVAGTALGGRDVLEVGSGRGGGALHLARRHAPRSTVGLDLSSSAVALCRRHRRAPGLRFVQGDATAMPFGDGTFDVVVNVESSHCYPSTRAFASEVARVLRPGGSLLVADFRPADEVPRFLEELTADGLRLEHHEDVTPAVVRALRLDEARKERLVHAWFPRPVRPLVRRFAAMEGSRGRDAFVAGRTRYVSARLVRVP